MGNKSFDQEYLIGSVRRLSLSYYLFINLLRHVMVTISLTSFYTLLHLKYVLIVQNVTRHVG